MSLLGCRRSYSVLALAVAGPLACATEPRPGVEPFQTDRTEYALATNLVLPVPMQVTFTNRLPSPVYLHLACGSGPMPSRTFARVAGGSGPVALGAFACITEPLHPPVRVESGATFVDTFPLQVAQWIQLDTAANIAMDTGTFRLVYDVQSTARTSGSWTAVDLLPVENRNSNVFRVRLPNQRMKLSGRADNRSGWKGVTRRVRLDGSRPRPAAHARIR